MAEYHEIRKLVAQRIKQNRLKKNWSQPYLAEQSLVSKNTIVNLEKPESHACQLDVLHKVCQALGTTLDQIIKPDCSISQAVLENRASYATGHNLSELYETLSDFQKQLITQTMVEFSTKKGN